MKAEFVRLLTGQINDASNGALSKAFSFNWCLIFTMAHLRSGLAEATFVTNQCLNV